MITQLRPPTEGTTHTLSKWGERNAGTDAAGRLLHFVAAGELEQGRTTLAEEVQGGIRVQHLDGVLPRGTVATEPQKEHLKKNMVLIFNLGLKKTLYIVGDIEWFHTVLF